MSKSYSCYGCKYLFGHGTGYSDWTWEETWVTCALGLNPALPMSEPFDFMKDTIPTIRWLAKLAHECDKYDKGVYITVSPDGHWNEFGDQEQHEAIKKHLGEN